MARIKQMIRDKEKKFKQTKSSTLSNKNQVDQAFRKKYTSLLLTNNKYKKTAWTLETDLILLYHLSNGKLFNYLKIILCKIYIFLKLNS